MPSLSLPMVLGRWPFRVLTDDASVACNYRTLGSVREASCRARGTSVSAYQPLFPLRAKNKGGVYSAQPYRSVNPSVEGIRCLELRMVQLTA